MPYQKILIFGLRELESRELYEMLAAFPIVDEVEVRSSEELIRPGVIYASAHYVEFALIFIGKELFDAFAKEAAKKSIEGGWQQIKQRVTTWKDQRNKEEGRERIHLAFGADGELIVEPGDEETRDV